MGPTLQARKKKAVNSWEFRASKPTACAATRAVSKGGEGDVDPFVPRHLEIARWTQELSRRSLSRRSNLVLSRNIRYVTGSVLTLSITAP